MIEKEFEHLMKPAKSRAEAYERLSEIVEALRQRCPWDKVQTRQSLRPCMIETPSGWNSVTSCSRSFFKA